MTREKIKLKEGASFDSKPNEPAIYITGKGRNCYIWIGNDAERDKYCYATLSGMKTLERLAAQIYAALGHQPMWLKPTKRKTNKKKLLKQPFTNNGK